VIREVVDDVIAPDAEIAFEVRPGRVSLWNRYQETLHDVEIPPYDPDATEQPDCVLGRPGYAHLERLGAEIVWEDPQRLVVLWKMPSET